MELHCQHDVKNNAQFSYQHFLPMHTPHSARHTTVLFSTFFHAHPAHHISAFFHTLPHRISAFSALPSLHIPNTIFQHFLPHTSHHISALSFMHTPHITFQHFLFMRTHLRKSCSIGWNDALALPEPSINISMNECQCRTRSFVAMSWSSETSRWACACA